MSMELTVRRLINLVTKDLTKMQDFWQERNYNINDSTNFEDILNLEKDVKVFTQKIQTLLEFWQRLKSLDEDDDEDIVPKKAVATVNSESQTEDLGSESPPLSLDSLHTDEDQNSETNPRSDIRENLNDNDPQESEVEVLQSPIFSSSVNHNNVRNIANNETSEIENEQNDETEEIQDVPSPTKSPSSSIDPSDDMIDYEVKIEDNVQESTTGKIVIFKADVLTY